MLVELRNSGGGITQSADSTIHAHCRSSENIDCPLRSKVHGSLPDLDSSCYRGRSRSARTEIRRDTCLEAWFEARLWEL